MNNKLARRRRIRQLLTLVIMGAVLLCIFPHPYKPLQWWSEQAALVAVLFLVLGLIFSYSSHSRLMFVCLGGSAAVSFNQYVRAEHNMPPHHQGSVSIGEIDLQKLGKENLETVLSGSDLPDLLFLSHMQDSFDCLNALDGAYPFLVRVQQDSGCYACLLSRWTIDRVDTLTFPSGHTRVAFRFPLENKSTLFGWIICPLDKALAASGEQNQRLALALRQPFVWLGSSTDQLPNSQNIQSLSACATGYDARSSQVFFSMHFKCNKIMDLYRPPSVRVGTQSSLTLSSYYVYAD